MLTRSLLAFLVAHCALGADFVGNKACSPCHAAIYRAYLQTPMAQSSGKVGAQVRKETFAATQFRDDHGTFSYTVRPDYQFEFTQLGSDLRVTSHVGNLAQSACKCSSGHRLWCAACHMPRSPAIQHVVFTDHSIPRRVPARVFSFALLKQAAEQGTADAPALGYLPSFTATRRTTPTHFRFTNQCGGWTRLNTQLLRRSGPTKCSEEMSLRREEIHECDEHFPY